MKRVYLGDGLYVKYDGRCIVLVANDGIQDVATVYLEPETLCNFINFVKNLTGVKTL